MVRFLLLPDDEREFVEWAAAEHGLRPLLGDRIVAGRPQLASIDELPTELPGPPQPGQASRTAIQLLLWHPGWGVNNLEPWGAGTAKGRVAFQLTAQAASAADVPVAELIDLERTRIVCLRRSGWTRHGTMHVAALQGTARPVRLQDREVLRLLRRAERWLRTGAVQVRLPANLPYRPRIYARPQAAEWVTAGGVVYPWDA